MSQLMSAAGQLLRARVRCSMEQNVTVTNVGRFARRVGEILGLEEGSLLMLELATCSAVDFDPLQPPPQDVWRGQHPVMRILDVVDVYLALVAERELGAWEPVEAVAYLQALAGTHFDPEAVTVFAQLQLG